MHKSIGVNTYKLFVAFTSNRYKECLISALAVVVYCSHKGYNKGTKLHSLYSYMRMRSHRSTRGHRVHLVQRLRDGGCISARRRSTYRLRPGYPIGHGHGRKESECIDGYGNEIVGLFQCNRVENERLNNRPNGN